VRSRLPSLTRRHARQPRMCRQYLDALAAPVGEVTSPARLNRDGPLVRGALFDRLNAAAERVISSPGCGRRSIRTRCQRPSNTG
jgi:hypothetical protein